MGAMNYSRRSIGIGAMLAAAAVGLALLPAVAPAYPSNGGGFVGGSRMTIALSRGLEASGIGMLPIGPGKAKGKGVSLPISEGGIEPRFGTGYVFMRGGVRLGSEDRSVSVRRLILNTAKKRLTGVIAGHAGTIAAVDDFKARRTDFGATLKVETLRLTKKAAALLGAQLAAKDVFRTGRLLGRAFVAGPWFTVPVTGGTIELALDEGFRQKLESLGVSVAPYESATPLGSAPLAFSLPEVAGDIDRRFVHGGINAREGGIRLVQAAAPTPREVLWGGIGINFENGYGGNLSDVVVATRGSGGAIGQIEFGETPTFNRRTGVYRGPPASATLSPFAVPVLNDAFAAGKPVFVTGEPLGTFSFAAGVR